MHFVHFSSLLLVVVAMLMAQIVSASATYGQKRSRKLGCERVAVRSNAARVRVGLGDQLGAVKHRRPNAAISDRRV